MINAKQVYGTYPHVQMRWYIERTMPEATKSQKSHALGKLTTKFVANSNKQFVKRGRVMRDVNESFGWADTPEGHKFWADIHMFQHRHEYDGLRMSQEFKDKWMKGVAVPQPGFFDAIPAAAPLFYGDAAPVKPKVKPKPQVGWWV